MKHLSTLAALLCCILATTFQVNAQSTNDVNPFLKEIEEEVKLADQNPTDGKKQLQAVQAFLNDTISAERDLDRALVYANRALAIAQEHPAPQDTLLSFAYEYLGIIYMGKKDYDQGLDYLEKALDAYSIELGRFDPITNGNKLVYGWLMAAASPSRGMPKIIEAFVDNGRAPQDKRIQNIDEANFSLEMGFEMLLAEQIKYFRYALPLITIDGKQFFIVQTDGWNMEQPLVGWQARLLADIDDNPDLPSLVADQEGNITVMTKEQKEKHPIVFNCNYSRLDPMKLKLVDGEARLAFLNPDYYNNILNKLREFKANNK